MCSGQTVLFFFILLLRKWSFRVKVGTHKCKEQRLILFEDIVSMLLNTCFEI